MRRALIALIFAISVSAALFAQMEAPKPGPEHKKLDMFVGSWTLTGDMKPGPMGPGGKMTENETCAWMEGNFFLECHAKYESASMGNGTGVAYMGYSPDEKAYTYREFNSMGQFEDARGNWSGDTITWTSDEHMGGMTAKGRFTMTNVTPTSYNFKYEMSQDGNNWNSMMEGKATKNK
jgi:Protein of unknown function (DUF1579)